MSDPVQEGLGKTTKIEVPRLLKSKPAMLFCNSSVRLVRRDKQTEINLSQRNIGDAEAIRIARALKRTTRLRTLRLSDNDIGDDGIKSIAEALIGNTTLRRVELYNNQIGDDGVLALADAVRKNSSLKWLGLDSNNIGPEGGVAISVALHTNTSLECLGLGSNQIGDVGATAIARSLRFNTTLLDLSLTSNGIGKIGARAFGKAIGKNSSNLRKLNLWGNQIGNKGAADIATGLKTNDKLKGLYIIDNQVDDEGGKFFSDALKVNWSVTRLAFHGKGSSLSPSTLNDVEVLLSINRSSRSRLEADARKTGQVPRRLLGADLPLSVCPNALHAICRMGDLSITYQFMRESAEIFERH